MVLNNQLKVLELLCTGCLMPTQHLMLLDRSAVFQQTHCVHVIRCCLLSRYTADDITPSALCCDAQSL